MKYCPQCNRQYDEPWITFCSDDGSMLIEELSPAVDPNWDPRIRDPQTAPPSEQETQWLPRDAPMPPAWVAPDERPPMMSPVWQPPPPPRTRQQSQTLAIASMITGILGLVLGCFGAIPGIAGVVLGWMALAQIKKDPGTTGGNRWPSSVS